MKFHYIVGALAALAVPAMANAAFVPSLSPTPTLIGGVVEGQSYTVTASGVSDLFNNFNNGAGLTFDSNGQPTYAFPQPYSGFPADHDPSQGPNAFCVGGAGLLCGALLGSFTATPTGPGDYFVLGSSYSFTASATGALYGLVNDVAAYGDNGPEGFTVTIAQTGPSAVPEPATWATLIGGFGVVGGVMRRHETKVRYATA